jgi:hypothetical protein
MSNEAVVTYVEILCGITRVTLCKARHILYPLFRGQRCKSWFVSYVKVVSTCLLLMYVVGHADKCVF